MEKHPNPFDEFLKETLKGHQLDPPEEAKKAFLREAGVIIQTRKGFTKWFYIPVVVILLSSIVAVLYFVNYHKQNTSEQIMNEQVNSNADLKANSYPGSDSELTQTSNPISTSISKPVINPKPASTPASVSSPRSSSGNKVPPNPESTPAVIAEKTTDKPVATEVIASEQGISIKNDTLVAKTKALMLTLDSLVKPEVPDSISSTPAHQAGPDTTVAVTAYVEAGATEPALGKKENQIRAGAYYLPEWMFNTVEGGKFVNNFGVEGNFYRGRVSIRTGAGISISKGTTDKAVEYNDYLGTYNKLDSITFIYHESSHDFMPEIYTSKEKVWDSIAKLDSSSIVKRYTYLQVPLVLGFDFWQNGRLSVGVRIGTIMSVMLQSKQITGTYDPGENLVLGIKNITPDQVSINWQAIGGFNASVAITKSFYFEFEPQAKYYYQSIYEKSGYTRKPWSIGIRTAVVYKF